MDDPMIDAVSGSSLSRSTINQGSHRAPGAVASCAESRVGPVDRSRRTPLHGSVLVCIFNTDAEPLGPLIIVHRAQKPVPRRFISTIASMRSPTAREAR